MAAQFDKLIEEIGNMSVMDLANLVKAFEEKFGVSAAMPVAAAGAATGASEEAPAAEKSEFKVLLVDGGSEKLKTIKALRQILTTLGLGDAKAAVENASTETPFVIAESANKADSQKMKETMEAAGAKVKLA